MSADFTPQSRFVRAFYWKHLAHKVDDEKSVDLLFHLLNSFDAPKGIIEITGPEDLQYTQYTSAYNIKERELFLHIYYNRIYYNRMVQSLKLSDFSSEDGDEIVHFPVVQEQQVMKLKEVSKRKKL